MTAIYLGRALPRASCDSCSSEGIRPVRGRASCFRWGLPERTSPCNSVSSYLTISTLPVRRSEQAVCFCGTFLRVAPTGRYPAPCPGEARTFLSLSEAAIQRTPRRSVYATSREVASGRGCSRAARNQARGLSVRCAAAFSIGRRRRRRACRARPAVSSRTRPTRPVRNGVRGHHGHDHALDRSRRFSGQCGYDPIRRCVWERVPPCTRKQGRRRALARSGGLAAIF